MILGAQTDNIALLSNHKIHQLSKNSLQIEIYRETGVIFCLDNDTADQTIMFLDELEF